MRQTHCVLDICSQLDSVGWSGVVEGSVSVKGGECVGGRSGVCTQVAEVGGGDGGVIGPRW